MVVANLITLPVSGQDAFVFSGEELARVSTFMEDKPRWTELVMYRTNDGRYVFQRLGRSSVYHRPSCRIIFGRTDMPLATDPGEDGWPCEECEPEKDNEKVFTELDKSSVKIARTPEDVLGVLRERDRRTKEIRLSPLAQSLLRMVADKDEEVKEATQNQMLSGATGE